MQMTGLIVGIAFVAWAAAVVWCAAVWADTDSKFAASAGLALVVLAIAFMVNLMKNENNQGPCLRYEKSTAYNPATKTVMTYRHCVDRGEWIDAAS